MTDSASNNASRQPGRPFEPGNCYGKGRPAGSRNNATLALDELAAGEGELVLRAAVEAAKAGDVQAMGLVLARVWPAKKGRPVRLRLPTVATAGDVSAALGALVEAVAAGELTPDEVGPVAALLEAQRKAIETVELEARLQRVEAAMEKGR